MHPVMLSWNEFSTVQGSPANLYGPFGMINKDNRIFGMHMLRDNAASSMVKNEVPIAIIAAILGHANTDTTDIYITTDESRLKECVLPMVGISTEVNP